MIQSSNQFLPTNLQGWLTILGILVAWIGTAAVVWTKLTARVNGQGRRIKSVEDACTTGAARMDRFEKDLDNGRRDQQDLAGRMGRVEKGIEDLSDTIQQGNLALGSQLHGIERLLHEQDRKTQVRLTRIETVNEIEKKVGPIRED